MGLLTVVLVLLTCIMGAILVSLRLGGLTRTGQSFRSLFVFRRFAAQRGNISGLVVGLTVGFLLLATLFPTAMTTFVGVDTTTWPSAIRTLWPILPVLAIIGVVLYFTRFKGGKSAG